MTADEPTRAAHHTTACLRCGAAPTAGPVVFTTLFEGVALRRCAHCGLAQGVSPAGPRLLERCADCARPVLVAPAPSETATATCDGCGECPRGRALRSEADDRIVAATTIELKLALAATGRWLSAPGLAEYLDGLAAQLFQVLQLLQASPAVPGGPTAIRVALLDESEHRSLALPDGTLVLTRGLLTSLGDEAELAFVLARELSHVCAGVAARSITALALPAMARRSASTDGGWLAAVTDLMRLGHGDAVELEADAWAVDALVALAYDAQSPVRGLERVAHAQLLGEPALAARGLALPGVRERLRTLEQRLRRSGARRDGRTNRQLFRRVVGRLDDGEPSVVDPAVALNVRTRSVAASRGRWRRRTIAALVVLAALAALLVSILAMGLTST